MAYLADLHVHSRFAIGTSERLTFETLAQGATTKGIDLLATGDIMHPVWFAEAWRTLRDLGNGLFELHGTRFVLGTEVNCVASQRGRSRRVHLLVFFPSLQAVEAARAGDGLASLGNLDNARPTLRTSPRDLVCRLLSISADCLVIPAHAWTPWYGVFGSKSGFDSLEECFGDLTNHIHAVETGLSSDPAMNWRVPWLDGVSLVSFSDAHSPERLGREATVFNGEMSFAGLARALRTRDIAYTIEAYAEAGKYHHSGHARCAVALSPSEVAAKGTRCPTCGHPLTLGVLQRVEALARRQVDTRRDEAGCVRAGAGRPPFKTLMALHQVLSESLGVGANTRAVAREYARLVQGFGSELAVLMDAPLEAVAALSGDRVAEGLRRGRSGEVSIRPGYDGCYGTARLWPEAAGRRRSPRARTPSRG